MVHMINPCIFLHVESYCTAMEGVFPVKWSLDKMAGYRSTRFTKTPSTLILGPQNCFKTSLLVQVLDNQ